MLLRSLRIGLLCIAGGLVLFQTVQGGVRRVKPAFPATAGYHQIGAAITADHEWRMRELLGDRVELWKRLKQLPETALIFCDTPPTIEDEIQVSTLKHSLYPRVVLYPVPVGVDPSVLDPGAVGNFFRLELGFRGAPPVEPGRWQELERVGEDVISSLAIPGVPGAGTQGAGGQPR